MSQDAAPASSPEAKPHRGHLLKRLLKGVAAVLAVWLLVAYVVAPAAWERYAKRHPTFDDSPRLTTTGDGHPGDPLNVSLIGTKADVERIIAAAGWRPADPLGLRSDLKIAADTVLKRSYDEAPVSKLFLFGRKEDLAFEQAVGDDPRKRNHVRLWKTEKADPDGRPVWIGSASYDERVGFSDTTGQITHHIAPDVDKERDHLFSDLEQTKELQEKYVVPNFHKVLEGRNGGGDPWHTDGDLWVGVIAPE